MAGLGQQLGLPTSWWKPAGQSTSTSTERAPKKMPDWSMFSDPQQEALNTLGARDLGVANAAAAALGLDIETAGNTRDLYNSIWNQPGIDPMSMTGKYNAYLRSQYEHQFKNARSGISSALASRGIDAPLLKESMIERAQGEATRGRLGSEAEVYGEALKLATAQDTAKRNALTQAFATSYYEPTVDVPGWLSVIEGERSMEMMRQELARARTDRTAYANSIPGILSQFTPILEAIIMGKDAFGFGSGGGGESGGGESGGFMGIGE
jgi:hypothetical protein